MWRITRVRTVIVTLSSVLVAAGSLWMPRAHLVTPYVDLAYSAPDAVVNKDGSWTVKVQSPNAIFGQIACTGNYVAPDSDSGRRNRCPLRNQVLLHGPSPVFHPNWT
jgi:hypothetical protein